MRHHTCRLLSIIALAIIAVLGFVLLSNKKTVELVDKENIHSLNVLNLEQVGNDNFVIDSEDDTQFGSKYWNLFASDEHAFSIAILKDSEVIQNLFPKNNLAQYRFTKGAIRQITLDDFGSYVTYSDLKKDIVNSCSSDANRGREINPCILDEFSVNGKKGIIDVATGEPRGLIYSDRGIYTLYFAFDEDQKTNNDLAEKYSTPEGVRRIFSLEK